MKLIIFGATGTVGRHLVTQALEAGHEVTAFTRNAGKFPATLHPALKIATGDVIDAAVVTAAVKGHDVILCALGDGNKGNVRFKGTENIVRAMERTGIKRLICQSTLGAGDSKGNLNFFWKYIMFGMLIKKAFLDHELQEQSVQASSLDWTIVRPGAFTDGPRTGHYQYGFRSTDKTRLKISRADVADFMLKQVSTGQYLRKAVSLSY
jgi:putative NADH-flavin reductase